MLASRRTKAQICSVRLRTIFWVKSNGGCGFSPEHRRSCTELKVRLSVRGTYDSGIAPSYSFRND